MFCDNNERNLLQKYVQNVTQEVNANKRGESLKVNQDGIHISQHPLLLTQLWSGACLIGSPDYIGSVALTLLACSVKGFVTGKRKMGKRWF